MNLAKSQKWRERQRAYEANQLHDWHAAGEAQAAPTSPPPEPPPTAPDFGITAIDPHPATSKSTGLPEHHGAYQATQRPLTWPIKLPSLQMARSTAWTAKF